jgi:hypothetical protein
MTPFGAAIKHEHASAQPHTSKSAPNAHEPDVVPPNSVLAHQLTQGSQPLALQPTPGVPASGSVASPLGPSDAARSLPLQAKLEVGAVDDLLEHEADNVARQVMQMPAAGTPLARCPCGGTPGPDGECAACRAEHLARAAGGVAAPALREAPPSVGAALARRGSSLDNPTRAFFEPRLGVDLGGVRVHDDASAHASARDVTARAYTVGNDIVFGSGQYQPTSEDGRALLAHELAHVMQQDRASRSGAVARSPSRLLRKATKGLDDVDLKVRQSMQVATANVTSINEIDENFGPGRDVTRLPKDTTATYGSSVPTNPRLREGLASTAADLLANTVEAKDKDVAGTTFRENTSVQVEINLGKYGGSDGVWRFTYIKRPKRGEILIEFLGTSSPGGTQASSAKRVERFNALGFRISGYSSQERAIVLEAVSLLPDAALIKLRGLTFVRAGAPPRDQPDTSARYDPDKHQITMFDRAFAGTVVRYDKPGAGFSPPSVRTVLHELGHAVDLMPLRAAAAKFESERDPAKAQAAKMQRDRAAAESGERLPDTKASGIGPASTAFKAAAAKDGSKAITAYGAKDALENYAEAFSLYYADPALLKALRPNTFQYFDTTYGPQAPPPATEDAKPAPASGGAKGSGSRK